MADNVGNLDTLISIAERILSELELLTSTIKGEALIRFQTEFLSTEQRRNIYNAIDGERDSQALADTVGCSLRAVQMLVKELLDNDLIDVSKKGKSIIPSKVTSKIATYYARLKIIEGGEKNNE